MNVRVRILFLSALLLGAMVVSVSAEPLCKEYEGSIQIELPAALVEYLEQYGIGDGDIAPDGSVAESVHAQLLDLLRDDDARFDINKIAGTALVLARRETGVPVYLEVGPFYWGHWLADDGV